MKLILGPGSHAEMVDGDVRITAEGPSLTGQMIRSTSLTMPVEFVARVLEFATPVDHSVDVTDMTAQLNQLADALVFSRATAEYDMTTAEYDKHVSVVDLAREIIAARVVSNNGK